jgi:hypothetical protein
MKDIKKIITGYWDGEPIWRYETASEVLVEALRENERKNKREKCDTYHK